MTRKPKRTTKKTTVAKRPRGGQRTITDEVMAELFKWTAEGKTIRGFCLEKKHSRTQVQERLKEPGFAEPIARARELGEQVILDEMIKIADNPMLVEMVDDKGKKHKVVHSDDVRFRKVQLWMREKLLVWINPGKYGQKTQIEKNVNVRISLSDTERGIRLQQLLDKSLKPEITVEIHEEEDEELSE